MRTLHRDVGDEVAEVVLIRARHGRRRRNRELVAETLLLRQIARLETRGVMRHDDRLAVVVLGRVGYVVVHGCALTHDATSLSREANTILVFIVSIVLIVVESWHVPQLTRSSAWLK